jgi:hypothetical protein
MGFVIILFIIVIAIGALAGGLTGYTNEPKL